MTCLFDGSGFDECTCCTQGRAGGCCQGDGSCCSCVPGCEFSRNLEPDDPETNALIDCICNGETCRTECESECAGRGVRAACATCVAEAVECEAELAACR